MNHVRGFVFAELALYNWCVFVICSFGGQSASAIHPGDNGELGKVGSRIQVNNTVESTPERVVAEFVISQAPMSHIVFCLNRLGINVCHENIAGRTVGFVDSDGVVAFSTDKPISLDLKRASVREILDQICKADSRYMWLHDARRQLFVLKPRSDSQLEFRVGPIKEHGNPLVVLARIAEIEGVKQFSPGIIRGGNHLPDVSVDVSRCTGTDILNEIVGQHPGMTWRFHQAVTFNYLTSPSAEAVRLQYPQLRTGTQTNADWRYKIVERKIDGKVVVVVEKQAIRKVPLTKEQVVALKHSSPAGIGVAVQQVDTRKQEQNVVASRLAGSWKLEPALTERLTGKATGPGTMVFVADPEVQKKVPAKFIEAAKKEGLTLDIRMAGYVEMRGAKFPFILTSMHGNPHVFYFRERDGDPLGNSESFNVMLAPARDHEKDLLFVGGDFNNQPFRAYERAPEKK